MRGTVTTNCKLCDVEVVATSDDWTPMCDSCTEYWQAVELIQACMRGEMDHLQFDAEGKMIPVVGGEDA